MAACPCSTGRRHGSRWPSPRACRPRKRCGWCGSLLAAAARPRSAAPSIAICSDGCGRAAAAARGPGHSQHPPLPPPPPTQQRRCTPDSLPPLPQVWHIESTGEVFRSYEAYLQRMELYKQGVWSCKYTGKGGLTFEEAQQAEAKAVKQLDSVRHWAGPQTAAAPAQLLPGPVFQPLWETGWQPQPTATAAAARSCRWQAGG